MILSKCKEKNGKKGFPIICNCFMVLSPSFLPTSGKDKAFMISRKDNLIFSVCIHQLFARLTHGCYGGKILDNMFGVYSLSSTRFSSMIGNLMTRLNDSNYKCNKSSIILIIQAKARRKSFMEKWNLI